MSALRLSWRDKLLLTASIVLLAGTKVAIRLLPFRRLLRLVDSVSPRIGDTAPIDLDQAKRIAWAVRVTARYVRRARCLPQALVVRMLLGWYGQPCQLRIGVAKPEGSALNAHAWVEHRNLVLMGGSDSPVRYAPLPDLYTARES